jgi:Protein of unknown function (DUF3592)
MLEQLFEKWRGIDRWPQTEATVVSIEVVSEGGYRQPPPSAKICFLYRDTTNSTQSGELTVDNLTSLYNLQANDTFQIRFNPQKPSKFYCSEAISIFTEFRLVFWLCFAVLLTLIFVIKLFR